MSQTCEIDEALVSWYIQSLKEFEKLAKSIHRNSKGEKLFTALEKGFNEMGRLEAPRKAIIFTESTRTQIYLRNILEARGFAGKVVLFNGSNTDPKSREIYSAWAAKYKNTDRVSGSRSADIRAALVDYFRDEATIMIATEAAAEGINLQFCSLIINYDMPWNPQRIEQRIGRCHRYGQKFDVVVVNFLNKANAADVRVYELLTDKFKLFDNVFGASDEILGSIENGVDFEKRIAEIYQTCRTVSEINQAFDELKNELKDDIEDEFKKTRKNLLENFDVEVHEKLRINLQESKDYLSKYESWLWNITKYFLNTNAEFAADEHCFKLIINPFPETKIHSGTYRIGKNIDDANVYRIGHPLAQKIIQQCKAIELKKFELIFNYSSSGKLISNIENLVGKSGYMMGNVLSITSFELEEFIQLFGVTDDEIILDKEQCERLLSLSAYVNEVEQNAPNKLSLLLANSIHTQRLSTLEQIGLRNANYFEIELEKLDHWGEDRRNSLKVTLKDLDQEIKEIKKQARLAPNLPDKLKLEKERKRLENERDTAWKEYDGAAKEIEKNKDQLIDNVEKRLKQDMKEEPLFFIKWKII